MPEIQTYDPQSVHSEFNHDWNHVGKVMPRSRNNLNDSRDKSDPRGEQLSYEEALLSSGYFEDGYDRIYSAANIPQPEGADDLGYDSASRIGPSLVGLGKNYLLANRKGYLAAYTRPDKGYIFIREPVPLSTDSSIVESLTVEERIAYIAELADPYRYVDTREDVTNEHSKKEQRVLADLVTSLHQSRERDMLAAGCFGFFAHSRINNPDLAREMISIIGVEELRPALTKMLDLAQESTPDKVVRRAEENNSKVLSEIADLEGISKDGLAAIERRAEEIDSARVVINMKPLSMLSLIGDTFKYIPGTESGTNYGGGSQTQRSKDEQELGIHEETEVIVDRPVYGTLVLTDEEMTSSDSRSHSYGEAVVVIKPEVAKNRTTYTYGDSLNNSRALQRDHLRPMSYEAGVVAELIFEQTTKGSSGEFGREYVEAQIIGGVGVSDIESVCLPLDAFRQYQDTVLKLVEIHPSIGFQISCTQEEYAKLSTKGLQWAKDNNISVIVTK